MRLCLQRLFLRYPSLGRYSSSRRHSSSRQPSSRQSVVQLRGCAIFVVSLWLASWAPLGVAAEAFTIDSAGFTITDVRLQGLQRVSAGTVFNLIPVSVGDQMDQWTVESIEASGVRLKKEDKMMTIII